MPIIDIDLADYPISDANIDGTGWMLNESAQYTAVSAVAELKIANSNLNGSGTLATLISGGSNGTFIKTFTIASEVNNSQGMIRLFLTTPGGSGVTMLLMEIEVFPLPQSSATLAGYRQSVNLGFNLQSGIPSRLLPNSVIFMA